jgi:chorismate mutase
MEADWGRERLARCRATIDELDVKILGLLNERTQVVLEIGRVKQELSAPIYEPKREEQVFQNIASHNSGPLSNDAARRVFERIIDEMRTVQQQRMKEREDPC